ncbi:MAG: dihydropteroate synthase [Deltaproteobacteria bacterium]|nr:dihydropteroate synthase [Deltaproteobacteria bacterium]
MKQTTLNCGKYKISFGSETKIMGILNVTPDSFSDGGKFFAIDKAIQHAKKMEKDGADIIDIGGESTRPFAEPVTEEEEINRTAPVIKKLADQIKIPISIDTTKSNVAKEAIKAGACIINDISGLKFDPLLAKVAADCNAVLIFMHMKKNPQVMQVEPKYNDLIKEIKQFLSDSVKLAQSYNVSKNKIIIDPGIGFGKTFSHNLIILKKLKEFKTLDLPVLIGTSRKAFIRNLLTKNNREPLPDSEIVETGANATIAAAALNGADIVRVHNVASAKNTLKIIDAIKNANENPNII